MCFEVRKVEELNLSLSEERKKVENQRNEVVRANAAQNVFLSNMSHEFRTPLSTIKGYGELILEEADSPQLNRTQGKLCQRLKQWQG